MEKDKCDTIPYFVHEGEVARYERTTKRLIYVVVLLVVLLFLSNIVWLWAWNQYDYETYTIDSCGGGNASFIGNNGVINNGPSNCAETNEKEWQVKRD